MHTQVAILESERTYQDTYTYLLLDDHLRRHTVMIHESLLGIEPKEYQRRSDKEHLDILAAGAVLLSLDPNAIFHRVDPEIVDRAYEAASRVKSIYQVNAETAASN
jgi:hypothetical protein